MSVTFNIRRTSARLYSNVDTSSSLPITAISSPSIRTAVGSNLILPCYFDADYVVYLVPRKLIPSVVWFRLVNELSGYVWCCLIISLTLSIGNLFVYKTYERVPLRRVVLSATPVRLFLARALSILARSSVL